MRARLKTVGVEEYHFVMESGLSTLVATYLSFPDPPTAPEGNGDWYIYDVGGSRSLVSSINSVCVYFRRIAPVPRAILLEGSTLATTLTKWICGPSL
jgi:hypothetical protein